MIGARKMEFGHVLGVRSYIVFLMFDVLYYIYRFLLLREEGIKVFEPYMIVWVIPHRTPGGLGAIPLIGLSVFCYYSNGLLLTRFHPNSLLEMSIYPGVISKPSVIADWNQSPNWVNVFDIRGGFLTGFMPMASGESFTTI